MNIEVGQKASYERTFTIKDVELFAKLSGDKGEHHMKPDGQGRVMLHGLLTATVPTKLGGGYQLHRERNHLRVSPPGVCR
jgi:3-hydroxybutyryl-CoA dehydratase